jgi:hypothetical protein
VTTPLDASCSLSENTALHAPCKRHDAHVRTALLIHSITGVSSYWEPSCSILAGAMDIRSRSLLPAAGDVLGLGCACAGSRLRLTDPVLEGSCFLEDLTLEVQLVA